MNESRTQRRPKHAALGQQPYFVSTRTKGARRIFIGQAGEAAERALLAAREDYGFLLLAYVLMPDHAHFVIVPAGSYTIARTMRVVKGVMSRAVNAMLGNEGAFWQTGFFDRNPRSIDDLNSMIRYIHRNPVKANLSRTPDAYAFTSADGRCLDDYQAFLNLEH